MHVIEDKKFRFRPEDCRVRDARAGEIFFSALRHTARVARVGLFGAGFGDGAGQGQGRDRVEGIDERGCRIGHGQHVRSFNALPAPDARAVEAEAFLENLFGQLPNRTTEMLPGPEGIDKLDIDHLGPALFS